MTRNNEFGRSMIEILGVLAIIGMVTMSISKLIGSMHDRYKVSRVTQQITDLRKNISNRYVAYGDYSVIDVPEMISGKVISGDMVEGENVWHAYNGAVEFSGDKDTYQITFRDLPHRVCLELALMNWQFNGDSDLLRIKINDTEFNWPVMAGAGSKEMPVSIGDATAACVILPPEDTPGAIIEDDNDITWTFR